MFRIDILKAGAGDAILITYTDYENHLRYVLIDGGTGKVYQKTLKDIIESIEQLDLIIVTHIDLDHIGGINKLLGSKYLHKIKKIFFNSADLIRNSNSNMISISDGIKLTKFIQEQGIEITTNHISVGSIFNESGLSINIISPTIEALDYLEKNWTKYEDEAYLVSSTINNDTRCLSEIAEDCFIEKDFKNDIANWSSLAFEIKYNNTSALLLGDAKDSVICSSLKNKDYSFENRYQVDWIKISHHGSKYNTSNEFLSLINCNNFIFSTNGTHNHPDIETISRIICHPKRNYSKSINLYFNYPKDEYLSKRIRLATEKEEQDFNFKSIYDFNVLVLEE